MEDKTLRRLKRRDLLQMLLVQCEETERLQKESDELKAQMETVMESYERLKKKLDVKDERLNEKDEKIAVLRQEINEMKKLREDIPEGSLAEAVHRINGIFTEAQRTTEQYLKSIQRNRTAARTCTVRLIKTKKQAVPRIGQIVEVSPGKAESSHDPEEMPAEDTGPVHRVVAAVSGDYYG